MFVWPLRWEIVNEEYQVADIWKFQWKDPIEACNDVNIGTKCNEYIIDKKKAGLARLTKEKLKLVGDWWRSSERNQQTDHNLETEH